MRPFGPHITGGQHLGSSLREAVDVGFTAAQIFLGPPQTPKASVSSGAEQELFLQTKKRANIPVYVHAPYVLHAFPKKENARKNNHAIAQHIRFCNFLGVEGYVLHMGGTKNYQADEYLPAMKDFLATVAPIENGTKILLENCASGNDMSGNLSVITKELIEPLMNDGYNVGLCLDTCHAWAWGYDLMHHQTLLDLCSTVTPSLKLIHLNSAPEKVKCGGHFDRHECIEKGVIDRAAFEIFLRMFPYTPCIAERDQMADILSDWNLVKSVEGRNELVESSESQG